LHGCPASPPPGCRAFAIIRSVFPGALLQTFTYGWKGAETDLSEPLARAIFEAAATPQTLEIVAHMRAEVAARSWRPAPTKGCR
jgi:hypothetical protein